MRHPWTEDLKGFFITSWKTVSAGFWEKGEPQGCVFVPGQCVFGVLVLNRLAE